MNLLTGSMTPEQFQQYQQEQQQAFFRWQQSQILNRDLDNLQQNPPSFHSESSQTLTQPQQVDSPKKGGRKKTKARRGKNVEDEPQEPVAAGRWLPVEEELLATCYVAVSEDNNVGSTGGSSRVRPNSGANGQGASLKRSRRKGFSRAQAEKRPHTNAVGGVEVILTPNVALIVEPLVNNSSNENKARKSNVQADEDSESDADDIYDETREFEAVKHSKS
ncbi:hypothetical protein Tco_0999780 [Tanacetum coccineum]